MASPKDTATDLPPLLTRWSKLRRPEFVSSGSGGKRAKAPIPAMWHMATGAVAARRGRVADEAAAEGRPARHFASLADVPVDEVVSGRASVTINN